MPTLLILLLAATSGCAALMHEALWTRRLIDLIGTTGSATAWVLGWFFAGLALGGAAAAVWLAQRTASWRTVAVIEVAIAVATIPALLLPSWTTGLWPAVGLAGMAAWQAGAAKVLLSAVVILPPALAMGTSLPAFVAAARCEGNVKACRATWLYAANTAGGAIGLYILMAWLLDALGVTGSMVAGMGLNLFVAAVVERNSFRSKPFGSNSVSVCCSNSLRSHSNSFRSTLLSSNGLKPVLLISFVSGVGVLASEVLGLHLMNNVVPSSLYANATLLLCVILVLAAAAAVAPGIGRVLGGMNIALVLALWLAIVGALITPRLFLWGTDQLVYIQGGPTVSQFVRNVLLREMIILAPMLFPAGIVFPCLIALHATDERRGPAHFAWLLAVNGLGGLAGALIGNQMAMPLLGPYWGFVAVAGIYALGLAFWIGCSATPTSSQGRRWLVPAVGTITIAALFVPGLGRMPYLCPRLGFDVKEVLTDRDGITAYSLHKKFGRSLTINNQYLLGSSRGMHDERRQMLIPMLLHPAPAQVAAIGLATGITAGAALEIPGLESLTVAELCPAVIQVAARHFADLNCGVVHDPRVHILAEDGRAVLAACTAQFDLVVGDLYRPWGLGEGRLFSVEYYQTVRRSLRTGGMFCQWLPPYQLTRQELDVILETFHQAFPQMYLTLGNFEEAYPLLGLIGVVGTGLTLDHLPGRCQAVREASRVRDPLVRHPEGFALLLLGKYRGRDSARRLNTLGNAWLELHAGKVRVTRDARRPSAHYLRGTRWEDVARDLRISCEPLDPAHSAWADVSQGILKLYCEQPMAQRSAEEIRRWLRERLPPQLLDDPGADWSTWVTDSE
jgi:spermidine synthase